MSLDQRTRRPKVVTISLFGFVMVTSAALLSIRTFPTEALLGWQSVIFNIAAIVMFLLPAAYVAAELASGWPGEGGVYEWVKQAFGERWGFTAVWIQWFQMTIGFIGILAFIAAALAYVFAPGLAGSKLFVFIVIVVVWWGATLANLRGLKVYQRLTTWFAAVGTFLPFIALVIGAAIYLSAGHAPQIPLMPPSWQSLMPNFGSANNLVLLVTFVFFFIGIEVTAAHVNDMKRPSRNYPIAILIVSVVMAIISISGALIVAWLVPAKSMSLNAGIMQAFAIIVGPSSTWIVPTVGILIVLGAVGEVVAWVLGPVRGLLVTARLGSLPPILQKTNKQGMPVGLLIAQAILVTFWGLVFLFWPGNINASFWALFALTTTVYIVMYFLMYAAAIKLRTSQPNTVRHFRIPGGKVGVWIVAGWGFLGMVFVFLIALLPPSQVAENATPFEIFMIVGTVLVTAVPLIIFRFRRASWVPKPDEEPQTETESGTVPTPVS
ncbi:amino acid permease [Arthrobacter sp. ERGS1:01]|uniref:amino acid permease n=1 Tax=Arthrobacter sp. ERGS1:01 TaxID=1704044 RepID=UPI0006B63827|nr:amino acid permease [Arthrobacter sp. ERGS1:01]ALE05645.1 amino acid permease [Arthrobacter sp. ERGS1:01]